MGKRPRLKGFKLLRSINVWQGDGDHSEVFKLTLRKEGCIAAGGGLYKQKNLLLVPVEKGTVARERSRLV